MTRSNRNIPRVTRIDRPYLLYFALVLIISSGAGGCALAKIPPFSFLIPGKGLVNDAYSRGIQYYEQGYYKSAVRELETVDPSHPKYKDARIHLRKAEDRVQAAARHINRALAHQRKGELFSAKREFGEALKVYPRHRRVRKLAEAIEYEKDATLNFYFEKAQEESEEKRYKEARAALLEALKSDPHDPRVLKELSRVDAALVEQLLIEGLVEFEKGDLDEAARQLEWARELSPNDQRLARELTKVYNRRALKSYREEKLARAVADLKRSLEINPEQREIRNQLDQVKTRMGLLKEIEP